MDAQRYRLGWTPGLIKPVAGNPVVAGSYLGLYAPFAILEPNRPATTNTMIELVSKLNRDDALIMCAVLNGITSGSGLAEHLKRQRTAYSQIANKPDGDKIDAWIRANANSAERVTLFFQGQLLELMRWVARYASPTESAGLSFQSSEACATFLRAAFLASELWSARIYADKLTGGHDQADALDRALGAFRKGVEEAGSALHIGVALARGRYLFETFLPQRLPSFNADFSERVGLTVEEYIVCTTMLMQKALDEPKDGYLFRSTYASQTTYRDKFDKYVEAESQTPEELARGLWDNFEQLGFRAIRERPILRTSRGQCAILDPTYFLDHFTVSPLFKVLKGDRTDKRIFTAFGKAFEDYALSILHRVYDAPAGLVKRLYENVHSGDYRPEFEIDALINEGPDLVLMEAKAAFMPERALVSAPPAEFLRELRKKYAVTGDPNDREVGVAQLAKCVRAIAKDKWNGAGIDHQILRVIYPVLVVHDDRMGSPGMGVFLDRIFRDLLGDVGKSVRVAPLTLMTIHDLENQESSDGFSLTELLAAYTTGSTGGMISLHNFMAFDQRFSSKTRLSEALIEKSTSTISVLTRELFPKTYDCD